MLSRFSKCSALLLLVFLFLAATGCTKTSEDEAASPDNPQDPGSSVSITSNCGVLHNSELKNPISSTEGSTVTVSEILGPNLVLVQREQGSQLVRLFGIGNELPTFRQTQARNELNKLRGSAILFDPVESGCPITTDGGGLGIAAQLFATNGKSYHETLLNSGLATVSGADGCGVEQVLPCYTALLESATPPAPTQNLGRFLWKPVAERDGNLVVLVDPRNAVVVVAGQALVDFGPSNTYGTTARANKPGCAFGGNVPVQVFNKNTGEPYAIKGEDTFFVPNGCSRVEF